MPYADSDAHVSDVHQIHDMSDSSDSPDSETWSDFGDSDLDTEDDEADMGKPGTGFTRGDWCVLARFIARTDWHELTPKERFDTFTQAVRACFYQLFT